MKTLFALLFAAAMICTAQEQKLPPADMVPVEKMPIPIATPAPVYPDSARRNGIEGVVWVKVWVDEQGKAHRVEVVKSDHEFFSQAAREAALQWRFKPAMLHNAPVAVWVTIPFKFKLSQNKPGKDIGAPPAPSPETKPVKK